VLVFAAACGGGGPPRLDASALPAAAPVAGVTELQVRLRNVGGRTLALDGVGRVCGCAAANELPAALAPGASALLRLRCRAPRTAGAARRDVALRTSDPQQPTTVLSEALPGSGPGPAPVYFGYVAVGAAAVRDVVLPGAVALDALPPPAEPALALEALPSRPAGATGVRVRFTPARAGVVRATLDLGTAGGALPIVAVGYDGVLATPPEVRASSPRGALPAVTVVNTRASPLAIARVEYPPGIEGELRTIVPGRQLRLVLRGRAAAEPSGAAAVRLLGADGVTPVLTIPVVAAVGEDAAPGRNPAEPAT
jgi:hypothetical protein